MSALSRAEINSGKVSHLRVRVRDEIVRIAICWPEDRARQAEAKYGDEPVDLETMIVSATYGTPQERRWLVRQALRQLRAEHPASVLAALRVFARMT